MKTNFKIIIAFSIGFAAFNCFASCPSADLTNDCYVNFQDFAVMANEWLSDSGPTILKFLSIPGEAFIPFTNVPYQNSGGMGGANLTSGAGMLTAPVHLPQGAAVIKFQVFYYNISATCTISTSLEKLSMGGGGYESLVALDSSGITGFASKTTPCSIAIDNSSGSSYLLYVYSSSWDGVNARIMGAIITYE